MTLPKDKINFLVHILFLSLVYKPFNDLSQSKFSFSSPPHHLYHTSPSYQPPGIVCGGREQVRKYLVDEWMDPGTICEHVVPFSLKQYKCQWWFGCEMIVFSCLSIWLAQQGRDFTITHSLIYGVIKAGFCLWGAVLHKAFLRKTAPVNWAHTHYWRYHQMYYWKWYQEESCHSFLWSVLSMVDRGYETR